ncbi:hypothetical protein GB882_16325 [Georgenia ruanii]|uniref:Uncharacterized protein n=1 Tax=Georgenia ruanii TaxID=348442 RepID=A0A7J9V284_9MICO|nr:hypothetical protein [Georgenia ruanii]
MLLMTGCGASQATAPPQLAAFDQPATAEDALPDGRDFEEFASFRRIGEVDGALVYAAQGPVEHPWCIVVVVDGPTEDDAVAGGSCADDAVFARRGVSVEVGGLGQHRTATLLPDDFTGQLEDGWEVVGPNLGAPTGA